jgi:endonuclease-3 related protein
MSIFKHDKLEQIFNILLNTYGPQNWWPGETQLEICIGAILTQNTNWQNASRAISNLIDADSLDIEAIHKIPTAELAELIRPSGYYNQKALKLKRFANFIIENLDGDFDNAMDIPTEILRKQLLEVKGIGPETADDMLLYAFDRPVFVVDAYTFRILFRHGIIEDNFTYNEIADVFHCGIEPDIKIYGEYHGLIVKVGKNYCKKSKPKCAECPLCKVEPLHVDIA